MQGVQAVNQFFSEMKNMMADTIENNYNHQLVDGILSSKNDS